MALLEGGVERYALPRGRHILLCGRHILFRQRLLLFRQHAADYSDMAIELIQSPVGLDPDIVFGHSLAAVDAGHPGVAGAGINAFHLQMISYRLQR